MATGYAIGDYSIGEQSIGGSDAVTPSFDPDGQACGGGIQPAPCCCCREWTDTFTGVSLAEEWTVYSGDWSLSDGKLVEAEDDALVGIQPFGEDIDCAYWRVEVDILPYSGVDESTWSVWIGSQSDRIVAEFEWLTRVDASAPGAQWYTRISRETTSGREVLAQQLLYGIDPPSSIYLCVVPFEGGYVARARGLEVEVEPIRTAEVGLGVRNVPGSTSATFDNFVANIKAADDVDTSCDCPVTIYESRCGNCGNPNPEQYQVTLSGFTGDFAFLNASWILDQCTTIGCSPQVGGPDTYPCAYWYPLDQSSALPSCDGNDWILEGLALTITSGHVYFWLEARTGAFRFPQMWIAASFDCATGDDTWLRHFGTISCTTSASVEVSEVAP